MGERAVGRHEIRRTIAHALTDLLRREDIGVAHHQVETALFEPGTDRYLGLVCFYGQCPKGKPPCLATGCGEPAFVRQVDGYERSVDAVDWDTAVTLWERPREDERDLEEIPF